MHNLTSPCLCLLLLHWYQQWEAEANKNKWADMQREMRIKKKKKTSDGGTFSVHALHWSWKCDITENHASSIGNNATCCQRNRPLPKCQKHTVTLRWLACNEMQPMQPDMPCDRKMWLWYYIHSQPLARPREMIGNSILCFVWHRIIHTHTQTWMEFKSFKTKKKIMCKCSWGRQLPNVFHSNQ